MEVQKIQIAEPVLGAQILAPVTAEVVYWEAGAGFPMAIGAGRAFDPNIYEAYNDRLGAPSSGDHIVLDGISAKIVLTSWNDGYALCNGARINFSDIERVHGTDGNDIVRAGKAQAFDGWRGISVFTGDGNDDIVGSAYDDLIDPGTGNNIIRAGAGTDLVNAGGGNDTVYMGEGDDNFRWGRGGADWLDPGEDLVYGGEGNDVFNAWTWRGGDRNAWEGVTLTVTGTRADGAISGRASVALGDTGDSANARYQGMELLWTHNGNDTVDGSAARVTDHIGFHANTRWGSDVLIGSSGHDTLEGGEGRDTITGGAGNDLVATNGDWWAMNAAGDGDADTLIFLHGSGQDTVTGFDVGTDILDFGDRDYVASVNHAGTLIDLGFGDEVLLAGVFNYV